MTCTLTDNLTWVRGTHLINFGGSYTEVKAWQQTIGSSTFPPGDTVVSGNFCYNAPANVNVMKIEFALDDAAHNCERHRQSPAMRPCRHTGGCPLAFEDVPEDSSYFSAVNFARSKSNCSFRDLLTIRRPS